MIILGHILQAFLIIGVVCAVLFALGMWVGDRLAERKPR